VVLRKDLVGRWWRCDLGSTACDATIRISMLTVKRSAWPRRSCQNEPHRAIKASSAVPDNKAASPALSRFAIRVHRAERTGKPRMYTECTTRTQLRHQLRPGAAVRGQERKSTPRSNLLIHAVTSSSLMTH